MRAPLPSDLAALPLFGGLPEPTLEVFAARATSSHAEPGDVIFSEGDPARALYVVHAGTVNVTKRNGDHDVVVLQLGPGDCFGEMSFVDMQPRSATVRATSSCELWMWPYTAIHERHCADSKCTLILMMNIARELSRRLRRADQTLCERS